MKYKGYEVGGGQTEANKHMRVTLEYILAAERESRRQESGSRGGGEG